MTNVAYLVSATHVTQKGLARAADNNSTRIEQILGMIEAIETNLLEKRKRIEKIRTGHEDLTVQYRQLGKSLDSATAGPAQQFAGIISDLAIAKLLARGSPAPITTSILAPQKPDLPPLPECVGEVQGTPRRGARHFGHLSGGVSPDAQ